MTVRSATPSSAASVVLAMLVCAATLPLTATSASAQEHINRECDASEDVQILLLFDTSGSLKRTDPNARRRDGGTAALSGLRRLLAHYTGTNIFVAVDHFSASYEHDEWHPIAAPNDEPGAIDARVAAVASRHDGLLTDYREALGGAAAKFSAAPPAGCRIVFWFTDGAHETVRGRSGAEMSLAESEQIDGLCAPDGPIDRLNRAGVTVLTAHLAASPDDAVPESLLRLYGRGDSPCLHPLAGGIVPVAKADDLVAIVGGVVADSAYESIEQPSPSLPCSAAETGDGDAPSTCEFAFEIEASTQSFELFIDLKNLDDPYGVDVLMRRPGSVDDVALGFSDTERLHPPTGLLTHAPTDNWRTVRAHQASGGMRMTVEPQAGHGWQGEWVLVFRGPEHLLARVAPPRVVVEGVPDLRAFVAGDSIEGEVLTDQSPFLGSVHLSVESDTNVGGLTVGDPDGYEVASGRLRWSSGGIASAVMATPGMADHLRSSNGVVMLRASLVQFVDWGDETFPWEVPGASEAVIFAVASVAWDGEQVRHPHVGSVSAVSDFAGSGSFDVEAAAGSTDGTLTLQEVSVTTGSGRRVDVDWPQSWSCAVPADRSGQVVECPPLAVSVSSAEDETADFEFLFSAHVDDADALIGEAADQGFGAEAQRAYAPTAQTVTAEGVAIQVIDDDERLFAFAAMLLLLVAVAVALRIHSAARVRRWRPLAKMHVVSIPVELSDGAFARADGASVTPRQEEMSIAPALTQRSSRAAVGPVTLRCGWLGALAGRTPNIIASSSDGACMSALGQRRGSGIVGTHLDDGWAVVRRGSESHLVVWDLPSEASDAYSRVIRAASAAAAMCDDRGFLGGEEQPAEPTHPSDSFEPEEHDPFGSVPLDPKTWSASNDPLGEEPKDPFS